LGRGRVEGATRSRSERLRGFRAARSSDTNFVPSRDSYSAQPLMAVPKRKTSRSRRDKRRAQHGISVTGVQVCPTCKQPKRPHRVCPNCKTYKGRDIELLRIDAP